MKTFLFKPFDKYSEKQLLIIGIPLTIVGSFLGYCFNARFDGVLDMHYAPSVSIQQPILDNLIDIFSISSILFLIAKCLNRNSIFMDVFLTCIIARIPYYILPVFNLKNKMYDMADVMVANIIASLDPKQMKIGTSFDSIIFILFSIFSLLLLIWCIALLFNGFKRAVNAKGVLQIILFSVSIILAETLSKILIYYFN
jgi:hypothetical protein